MAASRLLLLLLCLSPAVAADNDDPFQPAERDFLFDFSRANFHAYQVAIRSHVRQQRVFLNPDRRDDELAMVLPFELRPPANCEGPTRGILLVHGILDTAFAMRDIGHRLQAECFLVRAILLPGHGTRPGEMIDVTADDWLEAVRFGIRSLKADVDDVYIGGFSLGGLLSTITMLEDDEIVAGVLFAPALKTTYEFLSRQASWLSAIRTWLNTDEAPLPVRYQAMTTNAVAQVNILISRYRELAEAGLKTPSYVVVSYDDLTVDGKGVAREFVERFHHPDSRLEVYAISGQPPDNRSRVESVFDAEARIRDMAHVAIPFREDNEIFGSESAFRDCGAVLPIIRRKDVRACEQASDNWRGELTAGIPDDFKPMQRLTYNPMFDASMDRIVEFLNAVGD
ncbi:MAG: alpha/beta fold hydrolase [Pseudomonadota bacterium]